MSKIIINREKCQGYGTCVSICPGIFQLDKEGKSQVINEDCGACDCQRAINSCPTQAISMIE
jgi:ferredoxin